MLTLQPLTRSVSSADLQASCRFGTYLGTDCGAAGTGMWHSLAGLAGEPDECLDLARCFPLVRAEYQPACVGATLRARGAGALRLELKSADDRVLWWATAELPLGDDWHEVSFTWDPAALRRVKLLQWTAEPGANVQLEALSLNIRMPDLSFEEELILISYAKLARLYSAETGTVRERGCRPVGERESVACAGLFCLATAVACKMGMVKQAQAEQVLHKVRGAVSEMEHAHGLLPATVRVEGARSKIHQDSFYSSLETSVYYHSLLLAAQSLWDGKTLAAATLAVREIAFDRLRDADGYVLTGFQADGTTPAGGAWRDWSGEATLVLLLEQMATGEIRSPRLPRAGDLRGGVGISAEIPSLFYLDFSTPDVDLVTGTDWMGARRAVLQEQIAYFPRKHSKSAAARLGLYGLSVGEDPQGEGVLPGGTRTGDKSELIRPYYILLSALAQSRPEVAYDVLRTMREQGLVHPWGMVSAFTKDLDHTPLVGGFSAALECLAAYHLWAEVSGQPDCIYTAAEDCGLTREAIRVFYPALRTW